MSAAHLALPGMLVALGWAALLALAEGVLAAQPNLMELALAGGYADKPERFRRAIALWRITLLALAAVGASEMLHWWGDVWWRAVLALAGAAGAIAVFADLVPRAVGLWRAARIGAPVVRVAAASLALLWPLFAAAGVVDRALARLFGVSASRRGPVEPAQREMLLGVFSLADAMVSEVMTPRVDAMGLSGTLPFDAAVQTVAAAEYSRLPVYEGDLDHIVGVLYAKDLLPALFAQGGDGSRWRDLVRPADVVPETKTLDAQLRDFQRGPGHLAVVVDEFGGTAGIVTLEDVLEEIVGEIRDEYDAAPEPTIREEGPGVFVADGRLALDDLGAALGVRIDREDVQTAGGLAVAALGHVPGRGDTVELLGFRVTVELVTRRTVARLRFERLAAAPEAGGGTVSALVVLLGMLVAAFGATAAVAIVAVSRLELTRWVARRLQGAETAATLISRPGDLASAASALVAVGVALAGVAAPWALSAAGPEVTLGLEVLVGLPVLALAVYFLPRAVGRRWPERIVRSAVPRLRPAAGIFGRIVRGRAATERAELAPLFHDAASAGLAREDELAIVTGVMAFADRTVRDAMTPRTKIVAAPEGASTADLAALLVSSGYTRLPLRRGSVDEIVGMVHAFDVIKAGPGGTVRVRPVAQMPATRRCADALLDLRREGRHLAVVLDEFGGTAGIVTMEDLLEELVGEIFDELDDPRQSVPSLGPGILVVDAAHPLAALAEHFGVTIEAPPRTATAGGYVVWAAGRIPQAGERIAVGGLEFDVLEATPTKLVRLVARAASGIPAP